MKNLRKWNWGAFFFIFIAACLGAASNKSVNNLTEFSVLAFGFGIPFALFWAYELRED